MNEVACAAHWLTEHPQPDLDPAFAPEDPVERLRAALTSLYLDGAVLRPDARQLAAPLRRVRPPSSARVALALEFWTWQRLDREGLDVAAAAELMTGVVRGCPGEPSRISDPTTGRPGPHYGPMR